MMPAKATPSFSRALMTVDAHFERRVKPGRRLITRRICTVRFRRGLASWAPDTGGAREAGRLASARQLAMKGRPTAPVRISKTTS